MTAKPSVFPSMGRLLVYGVLALATAFFLLPLYAMLVTSFKDAEEIRSTSTLLSPLPKRLLMPAISSDDAMIFPIPLNL